ncbi:MAG: N-acetylmuramoyl-L-alanine amidase [Xanthobacteraceae bacterium]
MTRLRHATLALSLCALALLAGAWRPAWSQQQHPAYGAIRPAAVPLPPPNPAAAAINPAPVAKPAPAAKPAAGICHPETFRVVVDVGHTAAVPGAMSARGATEYGFNLALAQEAKQALVDAGFVKTVLFITDKPPPLGLMVRAAEANSMSADLFLAIHHDSVPDNLLKTWQYEGQDQHYNDDYPGYALFISNDNGDRLGSLLFGGFLGKELQARGLQYTPHYTLALMGHRRRQLLDPVAGVYRYDELIVLRRTRMPALLLEAGSIVNRQEELDLGTPDRRGRTSAAIVAAVADFCAARARPVAAKPTAQPAAPKSIGTRAGTITPAR